MSEREDHDDDTGGDVDPDSYDWGTGTGVETDSQPEDDEGTAGRSGDEPPNTDSDTRDTGTDRTVAGSETGTGTRTHPDEGGAESEPSNSPHKRTRDRSVSDTRNMGTDSDTNHVDGDSTGESTGLFDNLLSGEPIFEDKEVLRPAYTPRDLPHREDQIDSMATILVSAIRGDTPSNILIYGKTGTGKTASAKFVSDELETTSQKYDVPCDVEYINCEVTDTQYRVLAQLANQFIEQNRSRIDAEIDSLERLRTQARQDRSALDETQFDSVRAVTDEMAELQSDRESFDDVPMTGWPTDRVYSSFFDAIDYRERVVVIMLDEIDKLVEKSGDDTLYNLSRMNADLERSRVSIIGISNDLKFTDFLDPRVKSSLGEEEIVFPPYNANQLRDILEHRAEVAFVGGALSDEVIPLCAAFAAQEHGDARRALDLLRTAGELAERDDTDQVEEHHVRRAQEKIEIDRVIEVVRTLPQQSKFVLFAIILLEEEGVHSINTGEVYNVYKQLCEKLDTDVLTQRRVTDLISELDMLGIVNAVVVSKGRYGRTKEISLSVPLEETESVLLSDSRLGDTDGVQTSVQARFDS